MGKKILYLEDLYEFYSNYKKSTHYSAQDKDPIVVKVKGNVQFAETSDALEGLLKVHLQACHTELNRNQSYIEQSVMEKALPSFSNRPILGYIHEVDGQPEFYGHNMHMEDDILVHDEIPVGVIPESCNAQIVYDEEKGRSYVEVDGYIFEDYSRAAEILQREGECKVSVELSIRELSYNAKEKYLNIEDFFFSGLTILGKSEDGTEIAEGMQGSNIKLSDFTAHTTDKYELNEKLIATLDKLNETLSKFNINAEDLEEGGKDELTKFESLLEQYEKTVEDITFEYENLSDEELEAAFAQAFASDTEGESEESNEVETVEPVTETEEVESVVEDVVEEEKFAKTFEISHDDIRYALYNLLTSYEESDNEWYYISAVYDDHFVYEGWTTGVIYGQKYAKDSDNVTLDGERYNLHRELLTDSEYANLETMRANYSVIADKLAKYEAEPEKMAILESEDYARIADTENFAQLKQQENHFNLSVEEVRKAADDMLLAYAKNVNFNFSAAKPENKGGVHFASPESKISFLDSLLKK